MRYLINVRTSKQSNIKFNALAKHNYLASLWYCTLDTKYVGIAVVRI